MTRPRVATLALAIVASIATFGCDSPVTELVVVVDSELAVPAVIDAVHVTVEGPTRTVYDGTVALDTADSPRFPLTLGLVPNGSSSARVTIRAEGLHASAVRASVSARTSFVEGKTLVVRLVLWGACDGVTCGPGLTCTASGACASDELDPATLAAWTGHVERDGGSQDGGPGGDAGAGDLDGGLGSCTPSTEVCNGRDDDCNGRADETFDLMTDPTNCAGCGIVCPGVTNGMPQCQGGFCVPLCRAAFHECGGECVSDGSTSQCGATCGACPAVANGEPSCTAGACAAACNPGFADCNGRLDDGCEADLSSPSTCGSCGTACSGALPLCGMAAGAPECVSGCAASETRCGMSCVDTATDLANCGACGSRCDLANASERCAAGSCSIVTCSAGFADCDGSAPDGCETPTTTLTNCGGCGATCSRANATASCATGSCRTLSCTAGWGNCDANDANGCEATLNTLTNCGGCGVACVLPMATASCATRTCTVVSCSPGFGDCSPAAGCETALNTVANCGACGNACAPRNASGDCRSGTCAILSCYPGWCDSDRLVSNGCETGTSGGGACPAS